MTLSGLRPIVSLLLVLAVTSFAACATAIPFEGDRSRSQIAHDLGIPSDSILNQQRCGVSRYDGHTSAPAFECIYIATAGYAAVLDYDAETKQFKETLRIDKDTDAIAFATRGSFVGTLGQIQVRHGDLYYILDFVNGDMGKIGRFQDLRNAYDQLRSSGVQETQGLPYVNREVRAGGMIFIPVHVGR